MQNFTLIVIFLERLNCLIQYSLSAHTEQYLEVAFCELSEAQMGGTTHCLLQCNQKPKRTYGIRVRTEKVGRFCCS